MKLASTHVLVTGLVTILSAGICAVSAQTLQLEPAERVPHPVVDPASEEAQLAIQRFSVPRGLQVKLWAAEPMLANPVAIDFDEKGRLFVSETYRYRTSVLDIRDYMPMLELDLAARTIEDRSTMIHKVFGDQAKEFSIEGEVVRLVEDRDGDGVADTSNIFADGFNTELDGIASGVLARKGKVWFTNIPSLWMFEPDASGQKAASRTELLRGFGVRFNYTGHDFHGLAIGHDGKLYYSIGDRGAHVKGKEGQTVSVPDEGAVFRSNLDGSEFELFARGLRNPQELVFDEFGNLWTGDNDSDQGDLERLVYLVEGGDSGWRVGYQHAPLGKGGPWLRDHLWKPRHKGQPAYLLPPIANIEDGPSGLTYYPGTGLSPEFRGHFFITHFKGSIARSGIQSYTVRPDGASFAVTSSQAFMGGLLATDVTFGPDGVMYVADWVEGWPKSQRGRIYGITPIKPDPVQKALSEELAKLLAEGFEKKDPTTLRGLLAHPDRRARLEAQFALVERGRSSVKVLTEVASNSVSAPLARLHAVWGLTQLGKSHKEPASVLMRLLSDPDPEVRAQAAKGLGDLHHAAAHDVLVRKLEDPAPRVQFFAAQSLGKLKRADSSSALLALLERNADRDVYVRHAAVYALAQIGKTPALDAAVRSSSPAVRLGAVLTYRKLKDPAVAQLMNDADAYVAREAALAINDEPVEASYQALAQKLANVPAADEQFVLRAINANFRVGSPDNARALAQFATRTDVEDALRAEALTQLGSWSEVPQRDRLVGVYRPLPAREAKVAADALSTVIQPLMQQAPEIVQLAAVQAAGDLELRSASDSLVAAVANEKAASTVRASALSALDEFGASEQIDKAIAAAEKSSAPELRTAALQILARRSPQRALPVIRRLANEGTELEQQAAFLALSQLDSPETPQLLILGLDRLAADKIHPGAQVELLDAVEKSTHPQVQARWEKVKAQWEASGDALAPFRGALVGGNEWRGRDLFNEHAALPCARCHKVNGDGGEAGPDLTLIGTEKSAEYLLEAVLKPNMHIAAGFDLVTLQLKNGNTEIGSVVSESEDHIVLNRADGTQAKINKAQVSSRQSAPSSMPEIYGQVMNRSELRDLMAYLRSLDEAMPAMGTSNRALSGNAEVSSAGGHE
jgi:quinoprotein glucose dehydrogenase